MIRVATLLVVVGMAATAHAQAAPPDPDSDEVAQADALFHEAKQLLADGRVAVACTKLEESQSLAPGSGTLLNLGDCYERLGRTASAWATFRAAGALARSKGKSGFADEALARATALESRLSKLRIVVPEPVDGMVVQRGQVEVDPTRFGVATPVDPGTVVVRAEAPGRTGWSSTVTIPKKPGVVEVEVPGLRSPEAAEPPPQPEPVLIESTRIGLTQQIVGGVVGGLGLVAMGVGAFFGVRALRIEEDSNAEGFCDQEDFCTQDGIELRQDALTHAHASTGLIFGGAALAVTGLVIFLLAPDEEPIDTGHWRAAVAPRVGGASLEVYASW